MTETSFRSRPVTAGTAGPGDREPAVDTAAVAARVAAALPPLDEDQRRAGIAVYRLLAGGIPVTAKEVGALAGLDPVRARRVLADLPTARHQGGLVTAFLGLQASPGAHRMRFGPVDTATWCAWDTLFIPLLIGRPARAESTCPVTAAPVVVEVDPSGAVAVEPAGAQLTFLGSPRPYRGNVVEGFCRWVHFVADSAAGDRWRRDAAAEREDAMVLPIDAGVAIGRVTNLAVFGHAG